MPMQEILASLSDKKRREIVKALHGAEAPVPVDELCRSDEDRIAIQHVHAPKLAECGVIELQSDGLAPGERLEQTHQALECLEEIVHGVEVT